MENNNIVQIRAVADKLVFFKTHTCKTVIPVYIEFFVGHNHLFSHNIVEIFDFGTASTVFAIFVFDIGVILYGIINYVFKFVLSLLHLLFETLDIIISLKSVVFRNTLDFQFGKAGNIIDSNRLFEQMLKRFESGVDGLNNSLPSFAIFDKVVNMVFDEYFFERSIVPAVGKFAKKYSEFERKQFNGLIHRMTEDF